MTLRHHRIDYIEFAAPDLDALKTFQSAVFGWSFNDYGPDYAGIRAVEGEGEMGGLNPGLAPGSPGPLVIVYSDDLDATLSAVEANGGRVSVPPFEFPGGRRFQFLDPAGNELAVWTHV